MRTGPVRGIGCTASPASESTQRKGASQRRTPGLLSAMRPFLLKIVIQLILVFFRVSVNAKRVGAPTMEKRETYILQAFCPLPRPAAAAGFSKFPLPATGLPMANTVFFMLSLTLHPCFLYNI
jgi:hypothetical protein